MEVLTTTRGPFHDPQAKWNSRVEDARLVLIIGSESDRIRLDFTADEVKKLFSTWAKHLVEDRVWQAPEEPTP